MNRIASRRRGIMTALFLASLALFSWPAQAGQEAGKVKKGVTIEGITEYQLDNGVRFLLFPDPSASTVTVNMTVLVGSRHEGYGETGMAHLLEHMLFKGSKGFAEPWKILQKHSGGNFNGTTWLDRTNYYETMPATDENLEFGIRFEADRLVNSFIRHEDLAKEFSVVRSEFEQNENNPATILSQRIMAIAFEWHNYGKSTIGNRTDIERVPIARLQAFYRTHYQPDNIVLVVAGKFKEMKALEYITRDFGALKRPERVLDKTYTDEPAQDGERSVLLRRVGKVAVVGVVYHVPAAAHADFPAVDVLGELLSSSPSGRLYKALVETKKATRVSGGAFALHDPGVLEFSAQVNDGVPPEEVRDIMIKVLEDFKPATAQEVERAKQSLKAQFEQALSKSKSTAIQLSEWISAGDWRLMFIHRDRVAKVTPADVDRVAGKYLKQTNRTLGMYIPSDKVVRAEIPETPSVLDLVKNYKGGKALAEGETFDPTPANIEKRTKRLTLPNGLKVALLQKKTRGETVVGELTLHFGNEKSLAGYTSAARFLGPLMMRGTKKHSREEIQDLLDKLAAKLSAASDTGGLSFSWQAKRATLPAVLDLLGEVLREPTFPGKEFDIVKQGRKQVLEKALTDPQSLAIQYLMRQLDPYPKDDVRYVPTIEEAIERLAKVTRDQIAGLYAEQVGGQTGEFVLVGDFDADLAVKKIEELVKDWKAGVPYQRVAKTANTKVAGTKKTILTPDKENAFFMAGETFPLTDVAPDYAALKLGNFIMGGSATSHIFDRLRQKEGLSYGAGSQLAVDSQDKYALLLIYAICNPKAINEVDKTTLEEVQLILKKGVTEEELGKAKKDYLESLKVKRASDSGLADTLSNLLYLGRTFDYYADYDKKIAALTVSDVNRALTRYISPERLVIVRAGDFKKK